MKKLTIIFYILLVGCTTTKNISHPPTLIPPTLSKEEAESAIILSLKDAPTVKEQGAGIEITNKVLRTVLGDAYSRRQYWYYEGRGRDTVYAGFHYKNFYMRIEIQYTDTEITFKIVDSRNLKQSGNYIHKKALVWLSRLERIVRSYLGKIDRVKYEQEMLNKQIKPTQ